MRVIVVNFIFSVLCLIFALVVNENIEEKIWHAEIERRNPTGNHAYLLHGGVKLSDKSWKFIDCPGCDSTIYKYANDTVIIYIWKEK